MSALSPAPGRPRAFQPASALSAALELFWQRGYAATSVDDLTAAMGISRSSFYNTFVSKHALLLASVESYIDGHLATLTATAAAAPGARAAVLSVVRRIADAEGGRQGCFLVNCITELAPHDDALGALARLHLGRMEALLHDLLIRSGQTSDVAGPRAAALLTLAAGATLLRKAGVPPERIAIVLGEAAHLVP